ncbi:MAG TPA: tRNA epoxyqueuosine(34) reductase QueG [Terriglobales bacterium]|nr:tRNA epoxyqueuosine(34) reductase QueG [Terriglobales bacterium]
MDVLPQFAELIQRAAAQAGFELAGIAPVGDVALAELAHFPGWIAAGRAGEMDYMQARDEQGRLRRASVQETFPWARSVVVCALNYNAAAPYSTESADPARGWISRYAWGQQDYHQTVMARLRQVEAALCAAAGDVPDLQTRCYVDTGPLIERVVAAHAGLGWLGKNTCLIHPQAGSWLFLGVILTSLELEPGASLPDRCGSCTRCLDVCPTQAFPAPYELDASRCIAYLTIEKRGTMPEELRAGMGRHVFGCDLCQEVCPWNHKAPVTAAPEFQPRLDRVNPALEWLAELSEEEFRQKFQGTAVRRAKRSGLRRNAVVAMGNSGDLSFLPQLERLAQDPDAMVAEHARWALRRLRAPRERLQPARAQ